MSKDCAWTTQHEKSFIISAIENRGVNWLKKYYEAINLREEWGSIKKDQVAEHCEALLWGVDE